MKEISALVKLLDDPDQEIYRHVEERLLEYGNEVIDYLENAWEHSLDSLLQQRIENIVHKIQFANVKEDLNLWYQSGAFDLLQGALVINRYQFRIWTRKKSFCRSKRSNARSGWTAI